MEPIPVKSRNSKRDAPLKYKQESKDKMIIRIIVSISRFFVIINIYLRQTFKGPSQMKKPIEHLTTNDYIYKNRIYRFSDVMSKKRIERLILKQNLRLSYNHPIPWDFLPVKRWIV